MSENSQWYVWSIRVGKFDIVKKYIEDKVPEVKKILYPTITSERRLKNGESKKKKTPLYSGYIFLQYIHNSDNPATWLKLSRHPFISNYVGPCTPTDLVSVDSLQKLEVVNSSPVKEFCVGDSVRVNGGVFQGYGGRVVAVSNTINVEIEVSNKCARFVFSPDDLDVVARQ